MSNLKLYHFPLSAPSRGAFLALKSIGVSAEIIIIDLFKKEQLSESFIKINPQHCVPTLEDDGFVLWESRAIACYVAEKYGKDSLYPKDIKKRAIVNQRLIRAICYPILFGGVTEIQKHLMDELNTTLTFLDQFLEGLNFVAGDNLTIADTAILASISSILAVGWDISLFTNIQRWLKNCEVIPGYKENMEGAQRFGDAVKKNLKS
ncbi:unnamed protein product [Leptidea sinapis]|uniref:Uncharacterized protein n=1 Tax=Leptidea sinapis TaxID=189913 RepID=A0A5E4Q6U0_9NEOP|nr:unnamed protein product [Leptidea sinapis]